MAPAGSDLGAVEHVIFLMMENRSFDHYYGTYPGVRGFDDHPAGDLGAFSQPWQPHRSTAADRTAAALPPGHRAHRHRRLHLRPDPQPGDHSTSAGTAGRWTAFVRVHTSAPNEGPTQGVLTMGYYTRADLPYYYALADAYTICDGYHCSVMGPTHPNRLMQMSGTIDPAGKAGGPVHHHQRLTGRPLQRALGHHARGPRGRRRQLEVLWPERASIYTIDAMEKLGLTTDSVLPYFSQYQNPSSSIHQKAFLPTFPDDFAADVKSGGLAPGELDRSPRWATTSIPRLRRSSVSGSPTRSSRTLVANPEVWSKTVLFHMYDENDGFFDHVAPPVAPPGTDGEFLTGVAAAGGRRWLCRARSGSASGSR